MEQALALLLELQQPLLPMHWRLQAMLLLTKQVQVQVLLLVLQQLLL